MSKIGSKGIEINKNWFIEIFNFRELNFTIFNNVNKISFPKPFYLERLDNFIYIKLKTNKRYFCDKKYCKKIKTLWGTYRSFLNNFFIGKSKGFLKEMEIFGVGYSVCLKSNNQKNNDLIFDLGFSHKIKLNIPSKISVSIKESKKMNIYSENNEILGDFCYKIKNLVKRNPYKKKGIFDVNEVFKPKQKKKK